MIKIRLSKKSMISLSCLLLFLVAIGGLMYFKMGLVTPEQPQYTHEILDPVSEKTCDENGKCKLTLYSTGKYIKDPDTDEYVNFTDVVKMSFSNGEIKMTYKDDSHYYVKFAPFFGYNGQEYDWHTSKTFMQNQGIGLSVQITETGSGYKYNPTFTNISDEVKSKIDYIGLALTESSGLTWNDITKGDDYLLIKDRVKLGYHDLLNSHFTLSVENKSRIIIGNISDNIVDGTLELDPTVYYDYTYVLEDIDFDEIVNTDPYTWNLGFQVKWNITPGVVIPSGVAINDVALIFYSIYKTGTLDTDVRFWRVDDQTWTETSSVATIEGQSTTNQTDTVWNATLSASVWLSVNITDIIKTDYDAGNDNSTVRINDVDYIVSPIEEVETYTGLPFGQDIATAGDNFIKFEDRENSGSSGNRPILEVTYTVLNTAPTVVSNTISDTTPAYGDDIYHTVTCQDADSGDTITTYCDVYVNDTNQTSYTTSTTVVNNTASQIINMTWGNFTDSDTVIFGCHCSDGTEDSGTTNTSTGTVDNCLAPSSNHWYLYAKDCSKSSDALDISGYNLIINGSHTLTLDSSNLTANKLIIESGSKFVYNGTTSLDIG